MPSKQITASTVGVFSYCLLFLPFLVTTAWSHGSGLAGTPAFLENRDTLSRGVDSGFLPDTPTRFKLDLSGQWRYATEDGDSGATALPGVYDFSGRVTFDRTFEITPEQVDQYLFHLALVGVNYSCDVFINGEFVVNHAGGATSILQRIPRNLIQPGKENVIRIVVSNVLDPWKTLPVRLPVLGGRNYGGVSRDVFLLGTPSMYLKDVVVRTLPADKGPTASIKAKAVIEGDWTPPAAPAGKTDGPGFVIEAYDRITGVSAGRSRIVPLLKNGSDWAQPEAEIVLPAYKPWSPATPDLYLLKSYIVWSSGKDLLQVDEYPVNVGIRTVSVTNGDILLNGVRVMLKGVVWYEDHPARGSALTYEERERDVAMIKNLGANAIRFIHHPPHPYMVNLCDRYGLFALVELPLFQTPPAVLAEESYVDLASSMAREMVVRDRNSPSILAWGLGDGLDAAHPATLRIIESLRGVVRSLDTRPTYVVSTGPSSLTGSLPVEIAALSLDSRDLKAFKAGIDEWRAAHRAQAVIVARYGTEVDQGNRNGYSDPLSQQAQARFFLQRYDALRNADFDGGFVWSFNDWKGEMPSLIVNTGDPWYHTTGLVSAQREKRLAYDAVRAIYNGEKFPALPMGSHAAGMPIVYVVLGFGLLVGMAYLYNANRRFRDNLVRSVLNSYNFFADVRDQHLVSSLHSALLGVVVSVASAIVMSSFLYHFRGSLLLDNVLSYLLVSDSLKSRLIGLIRDPIAGITAFAVAVFLLLLACAASAYALRLLFKSRVYVYHAFSVTMWATAPLLFLIPLGMILYRVIESSVYILPAAGLVAVHVVWVFLRYLKGVSIIFDVPAPRIYALGIAVLVLVGTAVYLYYDATQSLPMQLSFLYRQFVLSQ